MMVKIAVSRVSRLTFHGRLSFPVWHICIGKSPTTHIGRSCHNDATATFRSRRDILMEKYYIAKDACGSLDIPPTVEPKAVFANNQLSLSNIEVFGFDYDYTLAVYNKEFHVLIYNLAKDSLINKFKYPEGIRDLHYDPHFAIRGLHFDVKQGFLMKIDAFHKIQFGTVYRGLEAVSSEEVKEIYGGNHVPLSYMSDFHGQGESMVQLVDWFAPPQMSLLANITQYFKENSIEYDPSYLFNDINLCIREVHTKGPMKDVIMSDCAKYIKKNENLKDLFIYLKSHEKKVFLASNSAFPFM